MNALIRIPTVLALTLMLSLVLAAPAEAQKRQSEKLDEFLSHLESNDKFMGTVAISVDGKLHFQGHYGHFDPENTGQKPDKDTQYRVGSITKMFTSVMILQVVEEGKLSLDTKLSKFFPKLKNASKVSIEQMLRHRSGLGSVTDDPSYMSWNTQFQSRGSMMTRIAKQPIKFQPDEKTEYSNTNYLLLGYIVESLTGNSYAEELKTRIVDRIGLKRTEYASKIDASKNVAASFNWEDGAWETSSETDPSIPHGAGSIVSTTSDLIVFIESLFAGKLIEPSTLKK